MPECLSHVLSHCCVFMNYEYMRDLANCSFCSLLGLTMCTRNSFKAFHQLVHRTQYVIKEKERAKECTAQNANGMKWFHCKPRDYPMWHCQTLKRSQQQMTITRTSYCRSRGIDTYNQRLTLSIQYTFIHFFPKFSVCPSAADFFHP